MESYSDSKTKNDHRYVALKKMSNVRMKRKTLF